MLFNFIYFFLVFKEPYLLLLDIMFQADKYYFKAIPALVNILQNTEAEDADLCAAAWTLGHIAKHSPQHSLAIAVANALPRMLQVR